MCVMCVCMFACIRVHVCMSVLTYICVGPAYLYVQHFYLYVCVCMYVHVHVHIKAMHCTKSLNKLFLSTSQKRSIHTSDIGVDESFYPSTRLSIHLIVRVFPAFHPRVLPAAGVEKPLDYRSKSPASLNHLPSE